MLKNQAGEKEKYCSEVQCLKNRILELENELKTSEGKCANLQTAVSCFRIKLFF